MRQTFARLAASAAEGSGSSAAKAAPSGPRSAKDAHQIIPFRDARELLMVFSEFLSMLEVPMIWLIFRSEDGEESVDTWHSADCYADGRLAGLARPKARDEGLSS